MLTEEPTNAEVRPSFISRAFQRFHDALSAAIPFLVAVIAAAFVAGTMALVGSVRQQRDILLEQQAASGRFSADLARVARDARRSSEDNNRLLKRSDPCLPGDPPDSERCVRQAAGEKVLADALNAIAAEQLRQHRELAAAFAAGLRSLQANEPVRAPTITSGQPAVVDVSPPPTTTTTCVPRGQSGKCRAP